MAYAFVNYRKADTGWAAARVHEELVRTFGAGFIDHHSMPPGTRYPNALRAGVKSADALLVLIGAEWLARDADGVRLVDRDRDWVREEIEQALAHGALVVPVLVDGASLPAGADLPNSIAEMGLRQVFRLSRRSAVADLQLLMRGLATQVPALLVGRLIEPSPSPGRSPGGLLRAERETVTYQRSDESLAELLAWADSPPPVGLRLLTGPAGEGKTRVARELCRRLRERGWVAGPAVRTLTGSELRQVGPLALPLLLVLDDAETEAERITELAAAAAAGRAGAPIRLLLLARAAGSWLRPLRRIPDEHVLDLVVDMVEQQLPPLAPDLLTRQTEFRRAAREYAAQLGGDPEAAEPADLASGDYAHALDLHAAALAAASGQDGGRHRNPFAAVLARETAYRDRSAVGLPDPHPDRLDQVVAAATLFGADTEAGATRLLAALPAFASAESDTVRRYLAWVRELYPGPEVLSGLRPQQLAEELIADRTDVIAGCAAVASAGQRRRAIRFLGDAAIRRPDLEAPLVDLIRQDPRALVPVAVEQAGRLPDGSALIAAVADVVTGDPAEGLDLVEAVLDRLPDRSASLGPYAVDLVRLALDRGNPEPERRATLETNLAARLCEVDEWAEAAAAAERAVAARRTLLAAEKARLAAALLNRGLALGRSNDPDGERASTTEALALLREASPAGARALIKALLRQAEGSEHADRISLTREALAVARALPDDAEPLITAALEALGTALPATEPEAQTTLREAVEGFRHLAATAPDPYRGELARALFNLAATAAAGGQREAAQAAAREANRLAATIPGIRAAEVRAATANLLTRLST